MAPVKRTPKKWNDGGQLEQQKSREVEKESQSIDSGKDMQNIDSGNVAGGTPPPQSPYAETVVVSDDDEGDDTGESTVEGHQSEKMDIEGSCNEEDDDELPDIKSLRSSRRQRFNDSEKWMSKRKAIEAMPCSVSQQTEVVGNVSVGERTGSGRSVQTSGACSEGGGGMQECHKIRSCEYSGSGGYVDDGEVPSTSAGRDTRSVYFRDSHVRRELVGNVCERRGIPKDHPLVQTLENMITAGMLPMGISKPLRIVADEENVVVMDKGSVSANVSSGGSDGEKAELARGEKKKFVNRIGGGGGIQKPGSDVRRCVKATNLVSSTGMPIVSRAVFHAEISPLKHMLLQFFLGSFLLHIRNFAEDFLRGVVFPTKRGVALTRQQVCDLLSYADAIIEYMEGRGRNDLVPEADEDGMYDDDASATGASRSSIQPPSDLRYHIGLNCFAVAKPEWNAVDLRVYWIPEGQTKLLPTRRGVMLKLEEFKRVKRQLHELYGVWRGLRNLQPCWSTHDSIKSQSSCEHCSPNRFIAEQRQRRRYEAELEAMLSRLMPRDDEQMGDDMDINEGNHNEPE